MGERERSSEGSSSKHQRLGDAGARSPCVHPCRCGVKEAAAWLQSTVALLEVLQFDEQSHRSAPAEKVRMEQ